MQPLCHPGIPSLGFLYCRTWCLYSVCCKCTIEVIFCSVPKHFDHEPFNGGACACTSFHGIHFGKCYFLGLCERFPSNSASCKTWSSVSSEGELYPMHVIVGLLEKWLQPRVGLCFPGIHTPDCPPPPLCSRPWLLLMFSSDCGSGDLASISLTPARVSRMKHSEVVKMAEGFLEAALALSINSLRIFASLPELFLAALQPGFGDLFIWSCCYSRHIRRGTPRACFSPPSFSFGHHGNPKRGSPPPGGCSYLFSVPPPSLKDMSTLRATIPLECFFSSRHCPGNVPSINPPISRLRYVLFLLPFCRWETWGSERLSYLLMAHS